MIVNGRSNDKHIRLSQQGIDFLQSFSCICQLRPPYVLPIPHHPGTNPPFVSYSPLDGGFRLIPRYAFTITSKFSLTLRPAEQCLMKSGMPWHTASRCNMITPYPAPHLNPLFQSVMLAFYKLFFKISLISSLSGTLYPPSMISVLSTIPGSISSVTPSSFRFIVRPSSSI